MSCPQCAGNPKAHSFIQFGESPNGTKFWYTGAGKAEELVDTPIKFSYFKKHMDEARGSHWIWVFDCSGSVTRNESSFQFMTKLVGTLSNEHSDRLQGIYILHPTLWIRAAVALLTPFINRNITKNVRYFKTVDAVFLNEFRTARLNQIPWRG
jgi:hypothetical protein